MFDGHPRFNGPEIARTTRHHVTRCRELFNEGRRQDDHVARRTIDEFLFHQTNGTKGVGQQGVGAGFNGRLECVDQTLCGTTAEQMNVASQNINPV